MKREKLNLGITYDGYFNIYEMPEVFVKFIDTPIVTLLTGIIDTGSYDSFINPGIRNIIKPAVKKTKRSKNPYMEEILESDVFDLKFQFAGHDPIITEEFGILPHLDYPFLLGTSFLSSCKSFQCNIGKDDDEYSHFQIVL